MAALLLVLASLLDAQLLEVPACTSAAQCKQMALEAETNEHFETFHSLAWRAVQTGKPNDPDLMFMLARAQALSGRPDDARVMLTRLAERGILHPEAETMKEFSNVRQMKAWPELLDKLHGSLPSAPASTPVAAPRTVSADPPPSAVSPAIVAPASILLVPPVIQTPAGIAYDKVSARMIIADDSSGTLRVLSEVTGNVVDLVSAGWAGGYHSNALLIDSKRGDLWVAGTRTSESILHHVQLISGRLLYSVAPPEDAGATRFIALAMSSASVFVLDGDGGRIFEVSGAARTMRQRMALPQRELLGLAMASDTLAYVTHAGGMLRVDLASKRAEDVTAAPGIALDGIEWMSYHQNSVLAIQRNADGRLAAMRLRFDRAGRIVTAADTFGAAAAKGAAVVGDTFFFVLKLPVGSAVARVSLRP